jgi:hypothetical protein
MALWNDLLIQIFAIKGVVPRFDKPFLFHFYHLCIRDCLIESLSA